MLFFTLYLIWFYLMYFTWIMYKHPYSLVCNIISFWFYYFTFLQTFHNNMSPWDTHSEHKTQEHQTQVTCIKSSLKHYHSQFTKKASIMRSREKCVWFSTRIINLSPFHICKLALICLALVLFYPSKILKSLWILNCLNI